jgi:hypothetical protein
VLPWEVPDVAGKDPAGKGEKRSKTGEVAFANAKKKRGARCGEGKSGLENQRIAIDEMPEKRRAAHGLKRCLPGGWKGCFSRVPL